MVCVCVCVCGCKNGKRYRSDNPYEYCGVIPTLFGCFFGIPSLYLLSLSIFFVTHFCCFVLGEKTMDCRGSTAVACRLRMIATQYRCTTIAEFKDHHRQLQGNIGKDGRS